MSGVKQLAGSGNLRGCAVTLRDILNAMRLICVHIFFFFDHAKSVFSSCCLIRSILLHGNVTAVEPNVIPLVAVEITLFSRHMQTRACYSLLVRLFGFWSTPPECKRPNTETWKSCTVPCLRLDLLFAFSLCLCPTVSASLFRRVCSCRVCLCFLCWGVLGCWWCVSGEWSCV